MEALPQGLRSVTFGSKSALWPCFSSKTYRSLSIAPLAFTHRCFRGIPRNTSQLYVFSQAITTQRPWAVPQAWGASRARGRSRWKRLLEMGGRLRRQTCRPRPVYGIISPGSRGKTRLVFRTHNMYPFASVAICFRGTNCRCTGQHVSVIDQHTFPTSRTIGAVTSSLQGRHRGTTREEWSRTG